VLKIEAKSNKHMYYAKKSDKAQQDHILVSWNVKVRFFSCYLYLPPDVDAQDQQPSYVFIGHTKWITSFIVEVRRPIIILRCFSFTNLHNNRATESSLHRLIKPVGTGIPSTWRRSTALILKLQTNKRYLLLPFFSQLILTSTSWR